MKVLPVALLALLAGCATPGAPPPAGVAGAIDAVLRSDAELAERLSRSLPPATLEAARREPDGWNVAILTWGSGRPGILAADCYSVSAGGEVRRVGRYANSQPIEVSRIDPATCTAISR